MQKVLVEDIRIGDFVRYEDDVFVEIIDTFEVNGEGRGFLLRNNEKISKACGTYLEIVK